MQRAGWTTYLALIAVLLQAVLVPRHDIGMLRAELTYLGLGDPSQIICSAVSDKDASSKVIPANGKGLQKPVNCLSCMGSASALAMLPSPPALPIATLAGSERIAVVGVVIERRMAGLRPPTRAPPTFA